MSDYSGIYNVVRGKLHKTTDELPNHDFGMMEDTGIVLPILFDAIKRAGVPSSYGALSAQQKPLFDGAAGRIVASRIRPSLLAGANEGKGMEVEKEIGDVRTRYAGFSSSRAPGSVGTKALEEQWIDEANEIIALLCKDTRPRKPTGGSFFAVPGARRTQEARDGHRAVDVRDLLLPTHSSERRVR